MQSIKGWLGAGLNALAWAALAAASIWLLTSTSEADQLIWAERKDPGVPAHCRDPQTRNFGGIKKVFFYGVQGSVKNGFTHEGPITREQASQVWSVLNPKSDGKGRELHPTVREMAQEIGQEGRRIGFDFAKEGDVLETIAMKELQREFPPEQYYITGSLSYHNENQGRFETLGELDAVVGRRDDCRVVAVGEVKLGLKAINHARDQMSRFLGYIRKKVCNERGGQPEPVCTLSYR